MKRKDFLKAACGLGLAGSASGLGWGGSVPGPLKEEVTIPVEWEIVNKKKKLRVPNKGADPGNIVTWKWTENRSDDPFFILFPDASPFRFREFQSMNGVITAEIVYDPKVGGARRFKYIIAGYDKKFMHILDPDIIIPKDI